MVFIDFQGKVAVVTGVSKGIGLYKANFSPMNAPSWLWLAAQKLSLTILQSDLESIAVIADVSKPNTIKKIFKQVYGHFGRIDILVNNAD